MNVILLQNNSSDTMLKIKSESCLTKIKKEVIQPQVPLRLPCDDLTLLAELRFDLIKN